MSEFLFNPALWMPAVGFIVAIVVFVFGNNRVKPAIRNTGLGLLGLMFVWCIAAFFIETRVEQCISRTKAIVYSVEAADWTKMTSLLDKRTSLMFMHGPDEIMSGTEKAAGNYGLKQVRILSTTAIEGPGTIDVTFTALLEGAQPLTTTFRFEYEQRSDGMLLANIVPVKIGDRPVEEVVRQAVR
jgi:hypothetical protein